MAVRRGSRPDRPLTALSVGLRGTAPKPAGPAFGAAFLFSLLVHGGLLAALVQAQSLNTLPAVPAPQGIDLTIVTPDGAPAFLRGPDMVGVPAADQPAAPSPALAPAPEPAVAPETEAPAQTVQPADAAVETGTEQPSAAAAPPDLVPAADAPADLAAAVGAEPADTVDPRPQPGPAAPPETDAAPPADPRPDALPDGEPSADLAGAIDVVRADAIAAGPRLTDPGVTPQAQAPVGPIAVAGIDPAGDRPPDSPPDVVPSTDLATTVRAASTAPADPTPEPLEPAPSAHAQADPIAEAAADPATDRAPDIPPDVAPSAELADLIDVAPVDAIEASPRLTEPGATPQTQAPVDPTAAAPADPDTTSSGSPVIARAPNVDTPAATVLPDTAAATPTAPPDTAAIALTTDVETAGQRPAEADPAAAADPDGQPVASLRPQAPAPAGRLAPEPPRTIDRPADLQPAAETSVDLAVATGMAPGDAADPDAVSAPSPAAPDPADTPEPGPADATANLTPPAIEAPNRSSGPAPVVTAAPASVTEPNRPGTPAEATHDAAGVAATPPPALSGDPMPPARDPEPVDAGRPGTPSAPMPDPGSALARGPGPSSPALSQAAAPPPAAASPPPLSERLEIAALPPAPDLVPARDPRAEIEEALRLLLPEVPCSRLSASLNGYPGTIELAGHTRSRADLGRLIGQIAALPGLQSVDGDGVVVIGEPLCVFLDQLIRLAEGSASLAPDTVGLPAQSGILTAAPGDRVALTVGPVDFRAFIYVDWFESDTRVVHLIQGSDLSPDGWPAGDRLRLGVGRRGLPLLADGGPRDTVVTAVMTSTPLFATPRPLVEPRAVYIDDLRRRLAEQSVLSPGFRAVVSYAVVRITAPRTASADN